MQDTLAVLNRYAVELSVCRARKGVPVSFHGSDGSEIISGFGEISLAKIHAGGIIVVVYGVNYAGRRIHDHSDRHFGRSRVAVGPYILACVQILGKHREYLDESHEILKVGAIVNVVNDDTSIRTGRGDKLHQRHIAVGGYVVESDRLVSVGPCVGVAYDATHRRHVGYFSGGGVVAVLFKSRHSAHGTFQ